MDLFFFSQCAMGEMNRVAEHINSMKRKYDAAVHVQEIQSLLHDWEVRRKREK